MRAPDETNTAPIGEDDLQAFIDGRLERSRTSLVEAWLVAHPDKARGVEADKRVRDELRAVTNAQIEPISASMRLVELRRANVNAHRQMWKHAAAASIILTFGVVGGWALRGGQTARSAVGTMADATAAWRVFANDQTRPVEFNADNRVQLAHWVSGHIGRSIEIPDLSTVDLRFIGGRLLSADAGAAGMFLYEDQDKQRFSFYVRATSGERPKGLQTRVDQGVETRFWFDGRHGYALTGPANSARLSAATNAVQRLYAKTTGHP